MGFAWSTLMHLLWGDDASTRDVSEEPREGAEKDTPGSTIAATQRHQETTQVSDASGGVQVVELPSGPGKMELRLMVETTTSTPDSPSIFADGRHWALSEPIDVDSASLPSYACVSYVWGPGRVPNPIHPSIMMSDRTMASFTAVARQQRDAATANGEPTRIWIDAFCVPVERMKKRATLESLGFVFARADAVVAVLAPQSIAAVEEMESFLAVQPRPAEIPNAPIAALERDEWIRSVWTYQETVNSKALWFVAYAQDESPGQKSYSGSDLLNIAGNYFNRWESSEGTPRNVLRTYYPHADDFQEILADYMVADYAQRSALQIMYGLDQRAHVAPENHFYSMIGALTDRPSARATDASVEQLAERFMELCEEKGDYSFIFCGAPRDRRPGIRWRPVPCIFPPIFTWHAHGEGQSGERTAEGLLLRNVLVFSLNSDNQKPQPLSAKTRMFMLEWLAVFAPEQTVTTEDPDDVLFQAGYRGLTLLHFKGPEGGWYPTEAGVFYALERLPPGEVELVVAVGVQWTFGAPALASVVIGGEHQYVPGTFLGPLRNLQTETYVLR
ncbi:hypothetical protein FKP32DRAFT_1589215 [Trametes sanguinea]|nr:hypothetical protein FKP32DRAFT_1589215 [Trametes sanguinea]